LQILSLPKYDAKTDSFVDGPLPKSVDSFFENDKKIKEFFEIKKHEHKHDDSNHHWIKLKSKEVYIFRYWLWFK